MRTIYIFCTPIMPRPLEVKVPGIEPYLFKNQINMELLESRRQAHKLTIMYKITNNLIGINKQEYLQAAHP